MKSRFRPRRWRQQCRLCRGLSRRRNRDCQSETERGRRGRRLQQLFQRAQRLIPERIVNAGLIGLHTASGAPHIVPPGATRPALGANPIAFGFPSADGPVIFDIGTASLMWGEVLLAVEPGKHYRRAWRSTPTGTPTIDDARRQAAVSPLLADIEAMDWLSRSRPWASSPARRSRAASGRITGFCFFVVDFGALLPGNPFAAQISRLVKAIQATPPAAGGRGNPSRRSAPSANASAAAPKASSSTVP